MLPLTERATGHGEVEGLLDASDYQHLPIGHHLPDGFGAEVLEGDLTRSQRAGKGAERSPARSGHHVIQDACVRLLAP